MLKALVCLFLLAGLFFVAWPLVLVFLAAAPVVLLGCLILKMLGRRCRRHPSSGGLGYCVSVRSRFGSAVPSACFVVLTR